MADSGDVQWTTRSLRNAQKIRKYLSTHFSEKEVNRFDELLRSFEKNVSNFPHLYPKSQKFPQLRRAVLHKFTSVFYTVRGTKIVVIAMQDNREKGPKK